MKVSEADAHTLAKKRFWRTAKPHGSAPKVGPLRNWSLSFIASSPSQW